MKANILFQWMSRVLLVLAVLGNFLPIQSQVVLASPVEPAQGKAAEVPNNSAIVAERNSSPTSINTDFPLAPEFTHQALMALGETIRVSVDSNGVGGNDYVYNSINIPSISADGRYVAFQSDASNLVSGDSNGVSDIFMHDVQANTTTRVSVDSAGVEGNGHSHFPSISADGRYVVFQSDASNLVSGDTNNYSDIFVRDTLANTTTRVSVDSAGVEGNYDSVAPSISADGRYVVFASSAMNLVSEGDTNYWGYDIFVHDIQTSTTTRVSVNSSGVQGNDIATFPSISADGRYVAFESLASNLVSGDTNSYLDIFVHDTLENTTSRVSVDSSGTEANGISRYPAISADGRYVAFASNASNLVSGDTNGDADVFVRDALTNTTTRVSVDSAGVEGNYGSIFPSISADGRYVVFESDASNLVSGDTNNYVDVFVRDTLANTTTRVSVDSSGLEGNSLSDSPSISADGRYVAFTSSASNLVSGDTNGTENIFVHRTTVADASTIVTNTNDSGVGSLRDTLASAASGSTITFALGLSGGTIYLATELTLSKNVTIDGSALDSQITISGDTDNNGTGNVRVFYVNSGVIATLNSLIITKGAAGGGGIYNYGTLLVTNSTLSGNRGLTGGGIENRGMMTLTNSSLSNNSAGWHGGGIENTGTMTITNSTLFGNSITIAGSARFGGAIYNWGGSTMTITNSTVFGNSSTGEGGGIANNGTVTLTNSTLSGNSAVTSGGGVYNGNSGILNYANTIIANSPSGGDCYNSATIETNTNNLVEDGSCSASLSGDPNLNLLLVDNGGATQTIALLAGSSAIDTGNTAICAAAPVSGLDQRGASRLGTYCDIGAYEHLITPAYTIGGTGDDVGKDITVDGSENTYVVGYSTTTWGVPIQAFNGGIYGNDTFVAKLDSSGNLLWNTFLQKSKGFNEVYSIGVDGSGNVYISGVGTSGSTFLVKLSANGNLLWNIPVAGGSFFSDMTVTANGTIYIAGSSLYAYAIKVDTNGNQLWNTSLGRSDNDCRTGIAVDTSGNAYATSCSHEVGYLDAFVTKLDINGNLIWNTFLGATGSSMTGSDIAIDASRNIYIFGASDSSWGNPLQPYSNSSPYFIAKLNQSGNLQWNTFTDLWGSDITTDISGEVHVAGLDSGAILDTNGNFTLTPLLQGSGITTDNNNIYTTGSEGAPSDVFIHKISLSQDFFPPSVASITRVSGPATSAASVNFTITFSEIVTGVDVSDFTLTTTGVSSPTVSGVSGSGSSYTVSVNTGSGNGTLRLNLLDDNSIIDAAANSLAAGFTKGEYYTIIKAATFGDVPLTYWASSYIERLFNAGITGGCGTGTYCPDNTVTRAQMAVFLLKGMHGSSFSPPAVGGSTGFTDVAVDYWAAAWIKQLAAEGITGGCGSGIYCPENTVTRAQMAIFLLKAKHGSSYSPANATGVFTDVPVGYWADKWIEQLAAEGVTSGCGTGIYCPDASVTRAQMAVFLVKAFGLP